MALAGEYSITWARAQEASTTAEIQVQGNDGSQGKRKRKTVARGSLTSTLSWTMPPLRRSCTLLLLMFCFFLPHMDSQGTVPALRSRGLCFTVTLGKLDLALG
ncbi:Hypothetical predicted protein [Marmota monax]|uniref:Uncharacterized protein n=1 Tax=Marmota monax TaxID=9995 RepID=A0A5E4C6R0_MARMO|nr:Hypothetical predicted protein [Marmota monax]